MLKSKVAVLSYVGEVTIFDADGQLINSSGLWPLPEINVSQRAYFQTFKNDPQSDAVLAEPLRSFITGGWTTVIAHRLTAADGTFLGVMSRRIDPGSYEKFFASVALGPSAAISLFHADGTMLARYPHIDELIGKKFKSAPLMKQVAGLGRPADAAGEEPGRRSGPARLGGVADPFPVRGHRHQHGGGRACRLARANPLHGAGGDAVGRRWSPSSCS